MKVSYGGTIEADAGYLYIPRNHDQRFRTFIEQAQAWANIYGCRAMGKSSLCEHNVAKAQSSDRLVFRVSVVNDIEGIPESGLAWVRRLALTLQLKYPRVCNDLGNFVDDLPAHTATSHALLQLIEGCLLRAGQAQVLLILDEYDCIQTYPFADTLVAAFRHVKNSIPERPALKRFSACFIGLRPIVSYASTEGAGKSVFCIEFKMDDLPVSLETVRFLGDAFEPDLRPTDDALTRLLTLSGGQPLVSMLLLWHAKQDKLRTIADIDNLGERLVSSGGKDADISHFRTMEEQFESWGSKSFRPLSAYKALLTGSGYARELDAPPVADPLLVSGLVRRVNGRLEPKGELFRRRFDGVWVEHMLSRIPLDRTDARIFKADRHLDDKRRKRLCIINTGGTLGMVERDGEVVRPRDSQEFLQYFGALGDIAESIEYVTLESEHSFEPRDSINVFPDQWTVLADYIFRRRHEMDAFVVCHGTDTMAYTASAVAFALGSNLWFPVVFTGSQMTPDVAYGDAHSNLYRACEIALLGIHEVLISFGNFAFRAVRAQKKDDRKLDGFESPTWPPLVEITENVTVYDGELLRKPRPDRGADIQLRSEFERGILVIPQHPGVDPRMYFPIVDGLGCKGVILQTLGAGNVADKEPYSFIPFIDRASRLGIPVIVTSQYPPERGSYAKYGPAIRPLEAGAIHAGNMTQSAAIVKFQWILADVLRRPEWPGLAPVERKELVRELMVVQQVVGEF